MSDTASGPNPEETQPADTEAAAGGRHTGQARPQAGREALTEAAG